MTEEWINDSDFGEMYFKPVQGENTVVFEDEGKTVEDAKYGKAVEFSVNKGKKYILRAKKILSVIKVEHTEHGTIVGHVLKFAKTGEGKATEYSNIRFEG